MSLRPDEEARLERAYTYHPPTGDQATQYVEIRSTAKDLALVILALVPEGRERSLALTKIEEAVFWANAGIARSSAG